jgi:tetratricopeptide (TPR) repeat protein
MGNDMARVFSSWFRRCGLGTGAWLLVAGFLGCSAPPERPDDKPTQPAGGGGAVATQPKQVEVSEAARQAFTQAVEAYQQQKKSGRFDYDDLLARFRGVLQADPSAAEAYYNLGCIHEAMRNDEEAQKSYQKALELQPDLTLAAANWGALLARQGKLDQALAVYQRALSKDAKNSPVLLNMAGIYLDQKKYEEALKKAASVLVRDPTNVGAYRIMAASYLEQGDLDMAELLGQRGLLVKKDDPILYHTLGLVRLSRKQVPEALAQFRKALDQQPDMVATRFNVAKVALDYKDFRVAKEEFSKILEYEPGNKQASFGLGIALRGAGEVDAAKAQFLMLAEKYSKDPGPRQWLCRMALRNFNSSQDAKSECTACMKLAGVGESDSHVCSAMYRETTQSIEMEKKMKEMEAKALEEQRKLEEKLAMLVKLRQETVDRAWEKAQKECLVIPPQKLDTAELEFVLDPLAITPDRQSTVKLVGYMWEDVRDVFVGTIKVKWRKLDEFTLEMIVPKDLELGPWDVLIRNKDKSELYFGGGLWVGEKPKCEAAKPEPAGGDKPPESGPAAPAGGGEEKPVEPSGPESVTPADSPPPAVPAEEKKAAEEGEPEDAV